MQLTTYTDYGLRALIMLGLKAPARTTVAAIARAYGVSGHHLVKVVGRLTQLGYVTTTRGKDGGVELAVSPASINLGQVVREMEAELGVVACLREADTSCVVAPACRLSGILQEATRKFLETLDAYTLEDILQERAALTSLLQISRPVTGSGGTGERHQA